MRFVATTTVGAEEVLSAELAAMGIDGIWTQRGAVLFEGELIDGYRACMWSRIASRVMMHLVSVDVRSAEDLYDGVRSIRWQDHLHKTGSLAVDFIGTSQAIRNSKFGALKVKDAVVDTLRDASGTRPSVELKFPDVRINCYYANDRAALSIDLSGEPLFRRGLGRDGGPAPVKETLAATILQMAGWPEAAKAGTPLFDPMCGSGTFLIEAAAMAADLAPGLTRDRWGFTTWHGHDREAWRTVLDEARERGRGEIPSISGSDRDHRQVDRAWANVKRAGMDDYIKVHRGELAKMHPPSETPGLLVTNPPYGERLDDGKVVETYRTLGDVMRRRFLGWTGWILAGSPTLARQTGLKPKQKIPLWNGRIECRLIEIPISDRRVARDES